MSVTMTEIEARAYRLSQERALADAIINNYKAAIAAIDRAEIPKLRRVMAKIAEQQAALTEMIRSSPELFEKPRTVVLHGIKLGYVKGKGKIVFDNDDAAVAAIMKHLPDQAETLIRWTGKPLKEAINQLDIATLKKIGGKVVDAEDQIVVSAIKNDFEKIANALLKDAAEEERVA